DGHVVAFCSPSCANGDAALPSASPSASASPPLFSLDESPKRPGDENTPVVNPHPVRSLAEDQDRSGFELASHTVLSAPVVAASNATATATAAAAASATASAAAAVVRVASAPRTKVMAVAVLAGIAAGLIVISAAKYSGRPSSAEQPAVLSYVPQSGARPVELAEDDEQGSVTTDPDPEQLREEARSVLSQYLENPRPRISLLAATALARHGDPTAVATLRRAMRDEDSSEVSRLNWASVLVPTGDGEAKELLLAGLRATRRDVRLEAARLLAQLGNHEARGRLRDVLGMARLRLGAAAALALLGDTDGMAVLREALRGRSKEERLRAAVALGRAGHVDGIEVLREAVGKQEIEVGAACALARLGDSAAVPALMRLLRSTPLRVEAATALRRLAASVEFGDLAAALKAGDDLARISAAEALLVLLEKQNVPGSETATTSTAHHGNETTQVSAKDRR
ncbi:MAG: HEAT repeat domain-containing protein, partial [Pseudomonadota bacterium]